jgi:hypothetical protein
LCFRCFFGSASADEDFDGPDEGIKEAPFDFLHNVAYCFRIVEFPGEKDTEGKCTSENRETVKEVKIDFRSDMETLDCSTKLLKSEDGSNLLSVL